VGADSDTVEGLMYGDVMCGVCFLVEQLGHVRDVRVVLTMKVTSISRLLMGGKN
jgi:hypothetical protein